MARILAPFKWIGHSVAKGAALFQSPVLLIMRIVVGIAFIYDGKVKLWNLTETTKHLVAWNIPHPHFTAIMTGSAEFGCGILLVVGLASRLATIPLIIVMCFEYATNAQDHASFQELIPTSPNFHPMHFMNANPFPFLCAAIVVFAFGPGVFSLDALLKRMHGSPSKAPEKKSH
jgi:putative oxidoreductase